MNKSLILWVALWSLVLLSCSDTTREDPSSMIAEWRNSVATGGNTQTCTYSADSNTLTCTEKTYKTVTIGTQVWMAENLAYLPSVNPTSQSSYTKAYYYMYDYNGTSVSAAKATSNYSTYGVLYNWTAALTACPSGWHLPTDAEWTTLTDYVGGESGAGTKLKANSSLWSTNTGTDAYGFSALPGGYFYGSYFSGVGYDGFWWSATEYGASYVYRRYMGYGYAGVYRNSYDKSYGLSARCVQD